MRVWKISCIGIELAEQIYSLLKVSEYINIHSWCKAGKWSAACLFISKVCNARLCCDIVTQTIVESRDSPWNLHHHFSIA